MPLRPLTIVPGSDPSEFLPRKFSTDNNSTEATDDQIESPLKAFGNAAKVPCLTACPFQRYRRRYRRTYSNIPGGKIIVARKEGELIAIKEIKEPKPLATTRFGDLRQIPHPNFQHVHEIFLVADTYFTVCDHEAITLWEMVRCPVPPAEVPISSIASQVSSIAWSRLVKLIPPSFLKVYPSSLLSARFTEHCSITTCTYHTVARSRLVKFLFC